MVATLERVVGLHREHLAVDIGVEIVQLGRWRHALGPGGGRSRSQLVLVSLLPDRAFPVQLDFALKGRVFEQGAARTFMVHKYYFQVLRLLLVQLVVRGKLGRGRRDRGLSAPILPAVLFGLLDEDAGEALLIDLLRS